MKSDIPESRAVKMLREVFELGRPLTYLRCTEEQRAASVLGEVSRRLLLDSYTALDLEPHRRAASRRTGSRTGHCGPPHGLGFYRRLSKHPAHLRPQRFSRAPARLARDQCRLRDVIRNCFDKQKYVVITSPVRFIPEEVELASFYRAPSAGFGRIGGISARRRSDGPPVRAAKSARTYFTKSHGPCSV